MFMNDELEKDFCDFLEFKICDYLRNTNIPLISGFWCDGVIYEIMADNETAFFTAFVGKTGQDKYKLFLKLGKLSKELLSKGLDIKPFLPEPEQTDAFYIDSERKIIRITLSDFLEYKGFDYQ